MESELLKIFIWPNSYPSSLRFITNIIIIISGSWQQYHNLSNWSLDNLSLWDKTELCVSVLGVIYGSVMNTVATILGQLMEFMEIIYSPWSVITMISDHHGHYSQGSADMLLGTPVAILSTWKKPGILVMIMMKWKSFWQVSMMWMPSTIISAMKLQAFQDVKRLSKDLRTCVKTFYLCPKDQKSPAQHFVGRYLHGY